MSASWPTGFHLERLAKHHPRRQFRCGQVEVDDWIATKALQQQQKQLSATKVLLDADNAIAGYYTLATSQVDFNELPPELVKRLPRRQLPVAVLAWFGINETYQKQGLGWRLLSQALLDCHEAGQTFAFVAVILDCINQRAKTFYENFDFEEMAGQPFRLFLSAERLQQMMDDVSA